MSRHWGMSVAVCASIAMVCAGICGTSAARGKDDSANKSESAISDGNTPTPPPAVATAFEKSSAWQKVDLDLQAAWTDAMKSGDTDRRLDAFVRCQNAIDPGDQSFLVSNGFIVRAASGPIASGHLKASDLPSVAGIPFVVSVKLSTKP